jgi:AmiR/NasT family two-component response regulator
MLGGVFSDSAAMQAPTPLLIVAPEIDHAKDLARQLEAEGLALAATSPCHMLVRESVRLAPEAIVIASPVVDAPLLDALHLMDGSTRRPVLLFSPALDDGDALAAVLDAGVQEVSAEPCSADLVRRLLPRARARFERDERLRRAMNDALARLDERKWIDRAKGVLMSARQLSEPDAFALLRTASMQANLRVGEVSRAVIEAAEAADAVNRAGQLRMLSQRIVKALALVQMGVERGAAELQLQESRARAQANIDRLAGLSLDGALQSLREATASAWEALDQAVHAAQQDRTASVDIPAVDGLAHGLLEAAEQLTTALQRLHGRHSLEVVNLAGRQRMLSQRVAKQALLAGWLAGAAGDAAAAAAMASVAEFDAALQQLERSPLAGDDIRASLAVARGQWQRLLQGVRAASAREGRVTLARESEALLQSFEHLTSQYEHSMQVLLG